MDVVIQLIQALGFPIACVVACGFYIYKSENRTKDEAVRREDSLMDANSKNSEALSKISDTILDTNAINRELSETNRDLVETVNKKIDSIDTGVNTILKKLDS